MATQYTDSTLPELTTIYKQALIDVLDDVAAQSVIDECETEFQSRGISAPYLGQVAHLAADETERSSLAEPIAISIEEKFEILRKSFEELNSNQSNTIVDTENSTVDDSLVEIAPEDAPGNTTIQED